jgi:hypothetical protein
LGESLWRPTWEERLAFWRDCYALSAFRDVHDYIPRWQGRDPRDICFRRAFETAILVSYASPFKQHRKVRLKEVIIPAEFKATHDEVIALRDKVIAHRDPHGPTTGGWGITNDVRLGRDEGGLTIETLPPGMSDQVMASLKGLIDYLIPLLERRTEAFRMQVYPLIGAGWFKVSLSETSWEWLVAEPN